MVPICSEFQAVDSLRIGSTWIVLGLKLITEIHMLINLLGEKTQHGKECKWYQQVHNFKLCPYKGVCSWGSLVTVALARNGVFQYIHVRPCSLVRRPI